MLVNRRLVGSAPGLQYHPLVNFLIALAAVYGSLNPDAAPPKNMSPFAIVHVLSNESSFSPQPVEWLRFAPVGALNLRPTLSLVFQDAFTGGAGCSGAFQPVRWMRLHGGLVKNSVRPGMDAAMTLTPFDFRVVPSISVEVGHYFPNDAASVLSALSTKAKLDCSLLQYFSHDTASGYLGFDVAAGPLALSVRGGITHTEISNLDMSRVFEVSIPGAQAPTLQRKQLATGPSGKVVLTVRL
jgi:hypothetical protein